MNYPKTGSEVYVSLNLSNTMLTGIGKGTITREEVSASYLKRTASSSPPSRSSAACWSLSTSAASWSWRSPSS